MGTRAVNFRFDKIPFFIELLFALKKSMNCVLKIVASALLFFVNHCPAQNVVDSTTSTNFNFLILVKSKDENTLGKAEIVVKVIDKRTEVETQTIRFVSDFILKSESYIQNRNNRYYPANVTIVSNENDCGDLIVADLNFDGREDLALKREEGGNGGPLYNYYLQTPSRNFIFDEYLTNEMSYFPDYIDNKGKSLHVNVRANSSTKEGVNYHYDKFNNVWSKSRSEIFNH